MGKWSGPIREIESFGELSLATWFKAKKPYIAVFEEEDQKGYVAGLYDGAEYTGIFIHKQDVESIYRDIERYTLGLAKEKPGLADPKNIVCIYM